MGKINEVFKDDERLMLINKFGDAIRQHKPSLGCNVDYTCGIICNLLDIPENFANGLFILSRVGGLCVRIIKELRCKSNARRSPFPPVIPYVLPID